MPEPLLHKIFGCWLFWKYRNPANRTCTVCGRHETMYMRIYRNERTDEEYIASQWWELMYPVMCDAGVYDGGEVSDVGSEDQ